MNKMNKKLFLIAVLALSFFLPSTFVNAADYLPKDKAGAGNVVVSGSQTYRNLYVGGQSVIVNNDILGDLFIAGGSLNVVGETEKDLFLAGGNVTVTGSVGEDARLAGGNIMVNAPIRGDTLIAGGTILINENGDIGGDLWAAGGTINITGNVSGDVKMAGGEIFINSKIDGRLDVRSEKLVFGPQSQVNGAITYKGSEEAVIQEGARIGQIEFEHFEKEKNIPSFISSGLFALVKLLALFVAGLILLKLFGKTSRNIVSAGYNNFWSNLGIGVAGMVAVPVVSVLLMFTVVGVYVAIILLLSFFLMVMVGGIYGAMLLGATAEKWIRKEKEIRLSWKTLLWGVIAEGIISFIPFVGWFAILVFCLAGLGVLLRTMKRRLEI